MGKYGRYFGARDLEFINSINAELMGDILQTFVSCFKIAADVTKTNIYGESSEGKSFYDGVELTAIIERADITGDDDNFGPDRDQSVVFKFRHNSCRDAGYFPQIGDVVLFNSRFHEVNNVIQEQLLGNQPDNSHSIICNTHYSRLSKLNIVER